ncbi:hypothetical protein [Kitasatospora sp. NPDC088351]|uniref:hypothetical protein n=1 Tax=Kitasatospora sp. NPDC088351 TaxID=3155180 RepID=UPI003427D568
MTNDVRVDLTVTPEEVIHCPNARRSARILRDVLPTEKAAAVPALARRRAAGRGLDHCAVTTGTPTSTGAGRAARLDGEAQTDSCLGAYRSTTTSPSCWTPISRIRWVLHHA